MRGLVHNFYTYAFRGQALVGLGLVVWFMCSLPNAIAREQYVGVPLTIAVFAGVIGLALVLPYLTPNWVSRPRRKSQLLPLMLSHAVLPLLYSFVAMSAVIASSIAEPMARDLAVGISLVLMSTSLICWGLGSALCFWPRSPSGPTGPVLVSARFEQSPSTLPADVGEDEVRPARMKAS